MERIRSYITIIRRPGVVNAWCMYDWANSVYNLVITTTFFPIYFASVTKSAYGESTVPLFGRTFKNSALYDYSLAFAYLVIAIIIPILSAIADSRSNKKNFMKFFCYMGGLACIGLYWFKGPTPNVILGVGCFVLATIGYVGSLVFYNSYLPEIAAIDDRDRISARGYSMGYIGSVILQVIGFGLVLYYSSKEDYTSGPLYTFVLVGLWWMGFAQITFIHLPESKSHKKSINLNAIFQSGFIELKKVWDQVKHMRVLKWFLFAFLFYSMGVQTVMLAATLFGSQILGLPDEKLIVTVVLIQLVAIPGAILISRLSGKLGNINVLMTIIVFWIIICLSAYSVVILKENDKNVEFLFYLIAVSVGLVMGGVQSLSRSTFSKLMPETKDTASFFSFYDITEKIAIVIGIFFFGFIDEKFGMKDSVLILIVFFILGLLNLYITKRNETATQLINTGDA
jgi:UMF1 family MFS transporter